MSDGERWTIYDQLDGATVAEFSSWTHWNAEERAREFFEAYPRQAVLFRERIVHYEKERVSDKLFPPGPADELRATESSVSGEGK